MRNFREIWRQLTRRLAGQAKLDSVGPSRVPYAAGEDLAALQADVDVLQSVLRQFMQEDELHLDELRQRIGLLESERDSAHREIKTLRDSLTEAVSRQETAEIHINTLEIRLGEQAERHKAVQQEVLIRERRQARQLNLVMTIALAAFVLGSAACVTGFLVSRSNAKLLDGINQGIRDIQTTMEHYKADTLLEQTVEASQVPTSETPPIDKSIPESTEDNDIPQITLALPKPDFIVTGSLPISGRTFSTRKDVREFFEENARLPGVGTLPGGVQYRVIIPGNGRIPASSDTVVIEYRAFRPDGTELDSSLMEVQPSTVVVSETLPGLREALQHMQENAQWELYIPPSLSSAGVRKRGRFGFEPLIYTVELLSIVTPQSSHDDG